VSAAIGVCRDRSYEGPPAVELEMVAVGDESSSYEDGGKRKVESGKPRTAATRRVCAASDEPTASYPDSYEAEILEREAVLVLDGVALFRAVIRDRVAGVPAGIISARFHSSVVELMARACEGIRDRTALNLVALSGGVFQNARVLCGLIARLEESGFEVLVHRLLPPNDACISLGQVAVAAANSGVDGA
jgi:hydrogenase maturation protein HypF